MPSDTPRAALERAVETLKQTYFDAMLGPLAHPLTVSEMADLLDREIGYSRLVAVLEQSRKSFADHRCGFGTCHCCVSMKAIDDVLALVRGPATAPKEEPNRQYACNNAMCQLVGVHTVECLKQRAPKEEPNAE